MDDETTGDTASDAPDMIVSASVEVDAAPEVVFALIADPRHQPDWDGNDNLAHAESARRVRAVGDVFAMTLTTGAVRENHIVEFTEGRLIAWTPAEPGSAPVGHLWRWEVEPLDDGRSRVTHTYDWTHLHDEARLRRARRTSSAWLAASLARLKGQAERS